MTFEEWLNLNYESPDHILSSVVGLMEDAWNYQQDIINDLRKKEALLQPMPDEIQKKDVYSSSC